MTSPARIRRAAPVVAALLLIGGAFMYLRRKSGDECKASESRPSLVLATTSANRPTAPNRMGSLSRSEARRLARVAHAEKLPPNDLALRKAKLLAEKKRERIQSGAPQRVLPMLETLAQRVSEALARSENPSALSKPGIMKVDGNGAIQVYVETSAFTEALLAGLKANGLRVELANEQARTVQGWVHASQLTALASTAGARQVVLPSYARHKAGSVNTQGDSLLKANLVRTLGTPGPYTGAGVKVGIISDGCNARATAVASGNLPPAGIAMHPTIADAGDEGTAMAEIVYDLAPGVELYAVGPATSLEMAEGIRWLVKQGCKVICDDLGFPLQPWFMDGIIALEADAAVRDHGCVFVSAAGNDAEDHWQGAYSTPINDTFHDFKVGTGQDYYLDIFVPAGGTAEIYLQWTEAFGQAGTDFDMYLWDRDMEEYVDFSQATQSGAESPMEFIYWTNTSSEDLVMQVLVDRYSSPMVSHTLELFVNGDSFLIDPNFMLGDSIVGHSAVANVISVGAIEAALPGLTTIESYSSRGPSSIQFPAPVSRSTPTITGVDGVSVSGAGGFDTPFYGTSAAAPHIAAICALLLSKNPNATQEQVRTALTFTAVNKGTAGFDNIYGHGLVDALAAVNSLAGSPTGPDITVEANGIGNLVKDSGLDFEGVLVGSTRTISLTLRNDGNALLTGLSIANLVNSTEFVITVPPAVTTLAPGQSTSMTVIFAPTGGGARSGSFQILSNDADESPFQLNFLGKGLRTNLARSTESGSLWQRPLENGTSPPDTLSNFADSVPYDVVSFSVDTNGVYTLTSIAEGWDNFAFLYSSTFNPIAPLTNVLRGNDEMLFPLGGEAGFTVTLYAGVGYHMVTTGYRNSDAGDYRLEIAGPGTVNLPSLRDITVESPPGTVVKNGLGTVDAGSVSVGDSSAPQVVTLINAGNLTLSAFALTKEGAHAQDFTLGSLGAASLAPGASTTFTIIFSPSNTGLRQAVLKIASDDPDENPFVLYISGTGAAAAGPEIAVLHPGETVISSGGATVSFGSVIGSSSRVFTVKNMGAADLTDLELTKDGLDAGDFSLSSLEAATLAPGATTSFTVTFTPGAPGPRSAALHLASNDADESPFDIALSGNGSFSGNQPAQMVIGAPDFVTSQSTVPSAAKMGLPIGMALSASGKFAVADGSFDRVLLWNTFPAKNGQAADVVVGKPDFVNLTSGTSASVTDDCFSVAFTPNGQRMVVSDSQNCRVLIWNTVPTSNGVPADVVIGQTNFTTKTNGVSSTKMMNPTGVLITPSGKLLVADRLANRVLVYNSVPTASGAAADVVIGQGSFTSSSSGSGPEKFNEPHGMALTADGKLLVADSNNNRILIFDSVPTANGAVASTRIGQSTVGGTSTMLLRRPMGVAVSAQGQLAIADQLNNRVLIYHAVPSVSDAEADVVLGQPNFNTATSAGLSPTTILGPAAVMYLPDGRLAVSSTQHASTSRVIVFGPAADEAELSIERQNGSELIDGQVLNLGGVRLGQFAPLQVLKVINRGSQPLTGLALELDGPNASDFLLSPFNATTLAPGESTTFSVSFVPESLGIFTASLRLRSNDADEFPFDLALTGRGVINGTLALGTTFILVNEEAGTVNIPIIRSGGTDEDATVKLTTTNGTATSPTDFAGLTNFVVTVPDGASQVSVPITLLNPAGASEPNETFTVTLSGATVATLGSPMTATVRIVDSADTTIPPAPGISFPAAAGMYDLPQGGGMTLSGIATDGKGVKSVKVKLNGGSFVDATLVDTGAASTGYSLPLMPASGLNTIVVQTFDTRDNPSPQASRSFTVRRPLQVNVIGTEGGVTAGFAGGTYREIGKSLTIVATAKLPTTTPSFAGGLFTGWTLGGVDVEKGSTPFTAQRLGLAQSGLEKNALTFIFREGLVLNANFITSPYSSAVTGSYNGLVKASTSLPDRGASGPSVEDGTAPSNSSEGFFTATVQNTGAFSAKLTIDGFVLNVSGSFDHLGRARFGTSRAFTQTVARTGKPSLSLRMDIGGPAGSVAPAGKVTGELSATEFQRSVLAAVSSVEADRAHFTGVTALLTVPDDYLTVTGTATSPAGRTDGVFTVLLPALPLPEQPRRIRTLSYTEADYPRGTGVGTLKVSKSGLVTVAGTLADGTAMTASGSLSQDLRVGLFAPLYSSKGYLSAHLKLDAVQPESDVAPLHNTVVQWARPFISNSQHYPYGWPEVLDVGFMGARYLAVTGQSVLKGPDGPDDDLLGQNLPGVSTAGNVRLAFSDGLLLETLVKSANLSIADLVVKVPDNDPTFTLMVNRTTGAVTGSFTHTDDTLPAFNAMSYQKGANAGAHGYFLTRQPLVIDYMGESGKVDLISQP